MKLVYLAGPYTADSFLGVEENIAKSRHIAMQLARHSIGFWSPVMHTAHFETYLADHDPGYDFWLAMTVEMLKRSDAILMVQGWYRSNGARSEWRYAMDHNLPMFYSIENCIEWYKRNL